MTQITTFRARVLSRRMTALVIAALLCSVALCAGADEPDLRRQLIAKVQENAYRLELRDSVLTGPGADKLLGAARMSQFVVLAEEHSDFSKPMRC